MSSELFYKLIRKSVSNYCSCSDHLHKRPWVSPPCKTSKSGEPKATSLYMVLGMANLRMAETDQKFTKIKKEIKALKQAHAQMESNEQLSDGTKKLIQKWQVKQRQSTETLEKSTQFPSEAKANSLKKRECIQNWRELRNLQNSLESAIEEGQQEEQSKEANNVILLKKENRKLRKKVKQLESLQHVDEEEQLQNMGSYRDETIKQKYSELLSYVIKIETVNEQLKKELDTSYHPETADKKLVAPFKQRIKLLEEKLRDQTGFVEDLQSQTKDTIQTVPINDGMSVYEEELLQKLGHTREVYEQAIRGYKEQVERLLQKCSVLQEEKHAVSAMPEAMQEDIKHLRDTCKLKSEEVVKLKKSLAHANNKPKYLQQLQNELIDKMVTLFNEVPFNSGIDPEALGSKMEEILLKYCQPTTPQETSQQLSQRKAEIDALKRTCQEHKQTIENLAVKLNDTENAAKFDKDNTDLTHQLLLEKKQVKHLTEHITTLKAQNHDYSLQLSQLKQQLSASETQMDTKVSILERLSIQLEQKIQECSSLSMQIQKLKEKDHMKPLEDVEHQLQLRMGDLQTQNHRLITQLSRCNADKESAKKKLRSEARSLQEQVDALTLKNSTFQRQLDTIISAYRATFGTDDGYSPTSLFNSYINSQFPHGS